jgi:transcription elongation factor Elf1
VCAVVHELRAADCVHCHKELELRAALTSTFNGKNYIEITSIGRRRSRAPKQRLPQISPRFAVREVGCHRCPALVNIHPSSSKAHYIPVITCTSCPSNTAVGKANASKSCAVYSIVSGWCPVGSAISGPYNHPMLTSNDVGGVPMEQFRPVAGAPVA